MATSRYIYENEFLLCTYHITFKSKVLSRDCKQKQNNNKENKQKQNIYKVASPVVAVLPSKVLVYWQEQSSLDHT